MTREFVLFIALGALLHEKRRNQNIKIISVGIDYASQISIQEKQQ